MKKIRVIFFSTLFLIIISSGCETLLDVDSDRYVFPSKNQLDSPNDSIYSMIGIFSQLEKLMDRYVLLGELRGDLMDVTQNADPYLREIYNFEISAGNPYNRIKDYYAVINNCNYLIANVDTAIILNAKKVMLKEYAAAKSIRAWTYMQLAVNYGTVKYYEQPMLALKDTSDYIEYSIGELLPVLIRDLEPWTAVDLPGNIFFGINSRFLYFPVRFVLGDLYLWNGDYENAAKEYHDLIVERPATTGAGFRSTWTVENGVFVERKFENQNWLRKFDGLFAESITLISGSTDYGEGATLDSISWFEYKIAPSSVAFDNWNRQLYYQSATVSSEGDLRGDLGSYIRPDELAAIESEYFEKSGFPDNSMTPITKFIIQGSELTKGILVYRSALLYLRYAEAVNRTGKPNLAFAVLKNGLKATTLAVDTIVPPNEKYIRVNDSTNTFIDYVNFEDHVFDENIGVHASGCGNVNFAIAYRIPSLGSLQDSIQYVEDKLIEELALETAFEGNRFQDLMRVAMRRGDVAFLADLVSEKYKGDKAAIRSLLMDESNWYINNKP